MVPIRSATEVLFGAYRRKVLAWLLLRPDESFYVRELARVTGVPAGSLHRELKLLTEAGLLLREPVGNQIRYRANRDCPIHADLAGIFRKTTGLVDVLREALAPLADEIMIAFVFGSLAKGKERSTSDVDVMVVGTASFTLVVEAFLDTREQLGREINPVVMTAEAVRMKHAARDRFIERLTREPKLFLMGTENDLRQLVENRPDQTPRPGRTRDSPTSPGRAAKHR